MEPHVVVRLNFIVRRSGFCCCCSSSSPSPQALKDDPKQRLCSLWEADELIKGCPEVQSLAVRVEGRAAEPQVVMRLFLIVAQAARGFFRSADQVLPAS